MRFVVFIVGLLVGGGAWAQADNPRIFKAGSGGAIILSTVAEMIVATSACTLGDRADWDKVVTAVDRRYRFCVSKDPAWSRLMEDFKEAEAKAIAEGSARSWASFAVDSMLLTRLTEARAAGPTAYCTRMPWELILVPEAATPEAKAEYMKANPQAALDDALKFFAYVRNLGTDAAWAEAPCDKDFWPEYK